MTSSVPARQPPESHPEAPRQRLHSASESQQQRPQQLTRNRAMSLHESGQAYSDKENMPPPLGELIIFVVLNRTLTKPYS